MLKLPPIKDQLDKIFSTKHARQFRMGVFRTKQFLDHNMSLILLLAVVVFGLSILDVQRGNRAILEGQEQNRDRQTQLVEQFLEILKEDTDQILTRVERSESLLCALFLQHDIDIEIPDELRKTCEIELQNRGVVSEDFNGTHQNSPESSPQQQGSPQSRQRQAPAPQTPPEEPAPPEPTPQQNGLQRAVENVRGVARGLRNLVGL